MSVVTRYDKLGANYLAFIKLASIRIWLRANESMRQRLAMNIARAQTTRRSGEIS